MVMYSVPALVLRGLSVSSAAALRNNGSSDGRLLVFPVASAMRLKANGYPSLAFTTHYNANRVRQNAAAVAALNHGGHVLLWNGLLGKRFGEPAEGLLYCTACCKT